MDESGKIVLEIKNDYPVELLDLTRSFEALAKEYECFANGEFEGAERGQMRLYVKEIRKGSIIAELQAHAPGLLPLIYELKSVLGFVQTLKTVIDWLKTPKKESRPPVTKNTLQNVQAILEPVAKDSASQVNIGALTINGGLHIHVNSLEAKAVQESARREIERIETPEEAHFYKVPMRFYQARNDTSRHGDRAIIESISRSSVKVVFASEKIKLDMLGLKDNLFRHEFTVDVTVENVEVRPVLYIVTELHGEVEIPTSVNLIDLIRQGPEK